jgi:hypothetical protein
MRRLIRLAALACAAALPMPVSMPAQDCPPIDPPRPALTAKCPAIDPAGAARLRVFLDRRTGRLRPPTPEEARTLFEAGGRGLEHLEPIEVVQHPNGMRTVDLKGAFSHRIVMKRNPDGSVSTRCVPGAAAEERQ